MTREMRPLGNSGLKIAPLMFGGNVFGWTIDEKKSFELLDTFVDAGFNAIDTADVYSRWAPGNQGGESETILGRWFQQSGKRDKVVLATKVGMEMGPTAKGLRKEYIVQAAERSLQRLQTDRIDLYQAHQDDPDTPLAETMEAFDQLVKQGKVRAVGGSNYTGARLRQALQASRAGGLVRYETLQPNYNLYDRAEYETDLEPVVTEQGIGVITYYSLAAGFLTGKYRSEADFHKSARGGSMSKFMNQRGQRILGALDNVSSSLGSTPAKVALAWLIARPSVTAPVASATSVEQLRDLLDAATLKLSDDALKQLNEASAY